MKLAPVESQPEPRYPIYPSHRRSAVTSWAWWKRAAAVAATGAVLMLPACGLDSCAGRTAGEPPPPEPRLSGYRPQPLPPGPSQKPTPKQETPYNK